MASNRRTFSNKRCNIETKSDNTVSTGGTDEGSSSIYKTLEEAIENKYDFTPSPMTLSQEYKFVKEMIRPVIVRERNGRYELTGGGVRYWAWVLAFGFDKDIDCIITK